MEQEFASTREPGLILVQIDGLSYRMLQRALERNRMPFLKKLIASGSHTLQHMYSGVPSTTPAVQGELFYGVKTFVPAFSFKESKTGRIGRMFDPSFASLIQKRLEKCSRPLLAGGASYSNIYSGGATTARFCPGNFDWNDVLTRFQWVRSLGIILIRPGSLLRILGLLILESLIAISDFVRGIYIGASPYKEVKFILSRVLICIFLRELITIFACRDVRTGVPRIHLNFLGYDEQAHRRGPSSAFAHWSLKGIDDCIHRIFMTAQKNQQLNYSIWVYSDHGQEEVTPFFHLNEKTIEETVFEALGKVIEGDAAGRPAGVATQRSSWLLRKPPASSHRPVMVDGITVLAMGPLGHIYGLEDFTNDEIVSLANVLVRDWNVPLALIPGHIPGPLAITRSGVWDISKDATPVVGSAHPYSAEVQSDLIALCQHPDSGELIISGYAADAAPVSFPQERGAHAGPGPQETSAFVCSSAPGLPVPEDRAFRPLDLRQGIQRYFGEQSETPLEESHPVFRIATYNIRSCFGLDGRSCPERIARILETFESDFIAIQELDCRSQRSGNKDQLHQLAVHLHMKSFFLPTIETDSLTYGIGILSRFPCSIIKAGLLPGHFGKRKRERRAAILASIRFQETTLFILNTHLSLYPRERLLQTRELLGPDWLGGLEKDAQVIVCGDFNAAAKSRTYHLLTRELLDVQIAEHIDSPSATWPTRYPFRRIDHIFVSNGIAPVAVRVPLDKSIRAASDHAPVVAALRVPHTTATWHQKPVVASTDQR